MYSSVYLRAINYRILFFIATFAIPSCCFLYRDVVLLLGNTPHHTTSLHITRQVKKYVKNSNTGEEKNRNKNRTKLIISKSKRAKFWAQNYGWWKVLDVSKSVFLCVSVDDWTKASKHHNRILNMQATCVSLRVSVCESNRIFISFVWCRSFCPEIMILMITSTAQKNEKFPRNLYKFIDKIKKNVI